MQQETNLLKLIENKGTLLFHYYRGSYAYGTFIEGISDMDEGAIYICNEDEIMGLREMYSEQVSDEKHDKVAYEIGRYFELLLKSNPNILEALFVPDRCIIYEHPLFKQLREHRNDFVSKETIKTLLAYSKSQIEKARGLNKKIVNPITERKQPIDFCFTFNDYQGTIPITKWLEERGLKQIYVGMNHLPNMNQMYGVFYDWGQHLHMEWKSEGDFLDYYHAFLTGMESPFLISFLEHNKKELEGLTIGDIYSHFKPKGYHGIQKESGTSNGVHLDSILKGDIPICHMSYNEDGYQSHCRMYKEYKEWEQKRNPVRYESNLDKNYDSKNLSHNARLLTMALEMAQNKGFHVDRTIMGDSQLFLDIRNHKYEYDDLLKMSDTLKQQIEVALPTCSLPEKVDKQKINNLLLSFRREFYRKK